jgi:hypothetical protein
MYLRIKNETIEYPYTLLQLRRDENTVSFPQPITDDILEGWDGKIDSTGQYAGNDSYIYLIEFEDQDGISYSKRGFVSLIR